jgi:hypothetical protein
LDFLYFSNTVAAHSVATDCVGPTPTILDRVPEDWICASELFHEKLPKDHAEHLERHSANAQPARILRSRFWSPDYWIEGSFAIPRFVGRQF